MSMKYNLLDLFCGCGGLTDGFNQTRLYKTLAALDWEEPAVKTLRKRLSDRWGYTNAEAIALKADLQEAEKLIGGLLRDLVADEIVDVVVGGPPCQAYSLAGRKYQGNIESGKVEGKEEDYRNFLFESYLEFVKAYRPKVFVFENVLGMLSAAPGGVKITDRIRKDIEDIGYVLCDSFSRDAVFDMSYYNIPQARKRVIIVGVDAKWAGNKAEHLVGSFYSFLRSLKKEEMQNCRNSLLGLPKYLPSKEAQVVEGKKKSHWLDNDFKDYIDLPNNSPRFHNARDIEIFGLLAENLLKDRELRYTSADLKRIYMEKVGEQVRGDYEKKKSGQLNFIEEEFEAEIRSLLSN